MIGMRGGVTMRLGEARVMALPRRMVEQIILGRSDPLNRHLIKLAGFDFTPETRQNFQREVRRWLNELQSLRFKPNRRTGSFKFYFDLLFDYPFGGVEVQNMRTMMDLISDEFDLRRTKTPQEMVEWLRQFHMELAERLHNGADVLDLIPE
jgi:plasmid maintenance system antidote protein VapI